jgi:hypothetical protein
MTGGGRGARSVHVRSFTELLASADGKPAVLRQVLADEVERGRVRYHATTKRYEIVREAFEPDVLAALAKLEA